MVWQTLGKPKEIGAKVGKEKMNLLSHVRWRGHVRAHSGRVNRPHRPATSRPSSVGPPRTREPTRSYPGPSCSTAPRMRSRAPTPRSTAASSGTAPTAGPPTAAAPSPPRERAAALSPSPSAPRRTPRSSPSSSRTPPAGSPPPPPPP